MVHQHVFPRSIITNLRSFLELTMDDVEIPDAATDNEEQLQGVKNPGLIGGLWGFFVNSNKWWLLPPILLLLLLGTLLALSQTAVAPFIYTLF
jgi:hypothetical protein